MRNRTLVSDRLLSSVLWTLPLLVSALAGGCSGDGVDDEDPTPEGDSVLGMQFLDFQTNDVVYGECELVDRDGDSFEPPVMFEAAGDGTCELYGLSADETYSARFTAPGYMGHYLIDIRAPDPGSDPDYYFAWLFAAVSYDTRDDVAAALGREADPERGHLLGSVIWLTESADDEAYALAVGCATVQGDEMHDFYYNDDENMPAPGLTQTNPYNGNFEAFNLSPGAHTFTAAVGGQQTTADVRAIFPDAVTIQLVAFDYPGHDGCADSSRTGAAPTSSTRRTGPQVTEKVRLAGPAYR